MFWFFNHNSKKEREVIFYVSTQHNHFLNHSVFFNPMLTVMLCINSIITFFFFCHLDTVRVTWEEEILIRKFHP